MVSLVLSTWLCVTNSYAYQLDARISTTLPHTTQFMRRHSVKIKIQAMQKLFALLFAHVSPPPPPTASSTSPAQTLLYDNILLLRYFTRFFTALIPTQALRCRTKNSYKNSMFLLLYFLFCSLFFVSFYYNEGGGGGGDESSAQCRRRLLCI